MRHLTVRHPTVHRTLIPSVLAVALVALAVSCGSETSSGAETLPPIRTTTSTSTTSTTIDLRERIYVVQPGDNVSEIARSYQVTATMIIELNDLPPDGEIQPGQELRIPNVVVDFSLPTTTDSTGTTDAP